jgi:hypothetical protein
MFILEALWPDRFGVAATSWSLRARCSGPFLMGLPSAWRWKTPGPVRRWRRLDVGSAGREPARQPSPQHPGRQVAGIETLAMGPPASSPPSRRTDPTSGWQRPEGRGRSPRQAQQPQTGQDKQEKGMDK